MSKPIYLDYAAATPMGPKVLEAMKPYFSDVFYNPSATYLAAKSARQALDESRAKVASWLGARPAEIIFTSGATESNNLAISGVAQTYPKGQISVSAIEHDSVLEPAKKAGAAVVPVLPNGVIDLEKLAKKINDKTTLISVIMVSNELGTMQPLKDIANLVVEQRRNRLKAGNKMPLYLHTDATQAANFFDLHTSRLGVDMMSLNGGKIYGPKQTGILYVKAGVRLSPRILGGGQEFGLRSGTENVPGAVGLAAALDLAQQNRGMEAKRLGELRRDFSEQILQKFNKASLNGSMSRSAPHILSFSFAGHDNERLMFELDSRGILCAVGSACSASSQEPSHVLSAIGLDEQTARSTLRFSMGRHTTNRDIEKTIKALSDIL